MQSCSPSFALVVVVVGCGELIMVLNGAIALSVMEAPEPSVLHSLPGEQTMECSHHYCNIELHVHTYLGSQLYWSVAILSSYTAPTSSSSSLECAIRIFNNN